VQVYTNEHGILNHEEMADFKTPCLMLVQSVHTKCWEADEPEDLDYYTRGLYFVFQGFVDNRQVTVWYPHHD
jgi:hypothetical protein